MGEQLAEPSIDERPPRGPVVDFNHFTHVTLGGSDESWRELREQHPVAWTDASGGHWVLTGYDAVSQAFRDWETFSSARTNPAVSSLILGDARMPLLVPEELDPPEWDGPRALFSKLLAKRSVETLRPRIRHWTRHFIDAFIGTGSAELARDLAVPVPAAVTMEWLGWPEDEWMKAASTFHQMARHEFGSPEFMNAGKQFIWLGERITEEVAARRETPRDDVLSTMANHEVDGERIPAADAEAMVMLAIGGGVDTTTSLTSSALVHLGQHPELRAQLRDDRSLIPLATEEFLRVYPPARTHARTVTRDVEFAGCPMRAGDRVLLSEAAACSDPAAFPDADRFVVDRRPNRHVAFGTGIHRCPGSHLARIEFDEILNAVLDRLPDYDLGEPVEYPNWSTIGGWAQIPVTFAPEVQR